MARYVAFTSKFPSSRVTCYCATLPTQWEYLLPVLIPDACDPHTGLSHSPFGVYVSVKELVRQYQKVSSLEAVYLRTVFHFLSQHVILCVVGVLLPRAAGR
jgi:hypothetical protein